MADYEPLTPRKGTNASSTSAVQQLKANWLPVTAGLWLLLSIYPVFVFFFGSSTETLMSTKTTRPHGIVTKTVVMPSFGATPIPGALSEAPTDAVRLPDGIDIFQDFKTSDTCRISSLELHGPFEPLCQDKESLLQAMSWGGRLGVDAPFSPRGCDMRWFTPKEICAILSKFSRINIMGDSMMRNMAVAVSIYLRADLVNGGRSDWDPDPEGHDCSCEGAFDDRACTFNAVVSTQMIWRYDPESCVCSQDEIAPIEYFHLLEHPIKDEDIETFLLFQDKFKPRKPVAYIMGHGLWNDLDKDKSIAWYEQIMNATVKHSPYLLEPGTIFPRLALTPNAAGDKKPDIFIARQGNIALTRFERAVGDWARGKGYDHLGTYNMSIQAYNPDGTHGGMRVNLLKAMMVFNWLNAIDTNQQ